jgi:hypothetical protein
MTTLRVFFTAKRNDFGSRTICRITGGQYSHSGVVFADPERPAATWQAYESWMTKDPATGTNGVRATEYGRILGWQAEDPANHILATLDVQAPAPLTEAETAKAAAIMQHAVGRIGYAYIQIAGNWLAARTGIALTFRAGSPNQWTCSETVLRALPPRLWPAFGIPNWRADDLAPSGTRLPSIEAGLLTLAAEPRTPACSEC